MIDVMCGDSVECGASRGGVVVCTVTVTGREYTRLKAIADTLNAMACETPNYGCETDNTPATVFAGFFLNCFGSLEDDRYKFIAYDVADAAWDGEDYKAVGGRLADALKRADEVFAKSRPLAPVCLT